jgi:probable F420-dependent oxidoreductase
VDSVRNVALGPIGLWTFHLDTVAWPQARELAQELESLGYAALWFPEAGGRDALIASTLVLSATKRIVVGTGIVPVYARPPGTLNAAWRTIETAFPERFILGIGVSHQPMVEGVLHTTYGPPVATMRTYLEQMDAAPFFGMQPATAPRRVIAALGPRMLALARDHADGALPYNVTPPHTAGARSILGPDKLLAVEQKVALTADASTARAAARRTMAIYLDLPNYVNNWKRLGFTDDDLADGGSDRFLDTLVAWGDEATIAARVREHRDAGADHVCIQVLNVDNLRAPPLDAWRVLAGAFF